MSFARWLLTIAVLGCLLWTQVAASNDAADVSEHLHSMVAMDHDHVEHVGAIQAAAKDIPSASESDKGEKLKRLESMLIRLKKRLINILLQRRLTEKQEAADFAASYKAVAKRIRDVQSQVTRMRAVLRATIGRTSTSLKISERNGEELARIAALYQASKGLARASKAAIVTETNDVKITATQNAAILQLFERIIENLKKSPAGSVLLLESVSELTAHAAAQSNTQTAHILTQAAAQAASAVALHQSPTEALIVFQRIYDELKAEISSQAQASQDALRALAARITAETSVEERLRKELHRLSADSDSVNMKLNKYFIDAMYFGDELSSLEKLRALMRARLQRMVEERRALYNSGKASLRRTRRQIKIIKQVVAKLRASEPEVRTQIVESLRDVNMVISAWRISAWSKCSASCGPGKQKRTVVCEKLGGSTAQCVEPAPPKTQSCLKKPCAQSCVLTSWTPFSECSVTCGGGVKERSRKVLVQATNGGSCPPVNELYESAKCNEQPCDYITPAE